MKQHVRSTTADANIVERRWLPVDIDPVRPADVSSSEAERQGALDVARAVCGYLNVLGLAGPVTAMSGNGYWLLYPVELPNDEASTALVVGVLGHLAERFNTPAVSIDTTVSNASRIATLVGTLKVKGDATGDRPHRRSSLLLVPPQLVPVPRDLLAALIPPAQPARLERSDVIRIGGDRMPAGWVRKLLDDGGIAYRESTRNGRTWYRLQRCPFHPDDDNGGDCGVGEDAEGKGLGHCFHNRGAGMGWKDFRAALGFPVPLPGAVPPRTPAAPRVVGPGVDAADLLAQNLAPLRWVVPDLVPEGTTILAAPPKVGKSCLVYQIAVEASIGGELLGRRVAPGSVLYLALEDGKRRGQDRLRAALAGRTMPRGRLEIRWDAHPIGEGLEEDIRTWLDTHPDAVMVAIDTLGKVRPTTDGRRNAYDVDVAHLARLQDLFRDRNVALVIVHHARKDASDDFLASVSGTYGLTGSADTIIVLRRKRLEAFGTVLVTGRDIADAEVSVRFDGLAWQAAPGALPQASFERTEVYAVIEDHGPIFPQAIANLIGKTRQNVQNMVDGLVQSGAVARTKGGYVVAGDVLETPRNPRSLLSPPSFSDDSGRNERHPGHTRARAGEWARPCRDYVSHQTEHRNTPDGWVCLACDAEEIG